MSSNCCLKENKLQLVRNVSTVSVKIELSPYCHMKILKLLQ